MSDFLQQYGIAIYISQDILIVPFQSDFYEEVINALRLEILNQLHDHSEIKGVIIDLSKINLIDLENMRTLEETVQMANLLGVPGFLAGIQPGVTLALVELGYEPKEVKTTLNVGQAVLLINKSTLLAQEQANEGEDDKILTEEDDL